jgi:copper chaperone CopZ
MILMKRSQKINMPLLWQDWRGESPAERHKADTLQMAQKVADDQWTVIRIEGMHCHQCERAIQKLLGQLPGVHEAEVDFNSGQASVLFNHTVVTSEQLLEAIREAGYQATPTSHA